MKAVTGTVHRLVRAPLPALPEDRDPGARPGRPRERRDAAPTWVIRPAQPQDSEQIVAVYRACFPEALLPYTILGYDGAAAYLRSALASPDHERRARYYVCVCGDTLGGFCEIRWSGASAFLNHIYVDAPRRGTGIGRALLRDALSDGPGVAGDASLALDVFSDNERARRWYDALGLRFAHEIAWVEYRLSRPRKGPDPRWSVLDLPQADQAHARQGFSQFRLQTPTRTHLVGRLGRSYFRTTSAEILDDPVAMSGLSSLDPRRTLVCIDAAHAIRAAARDGGVLLARAYRLDGPIPTALARLRQPSRSTLPVQS